MDILIKNVSLPKSSIDALHITIMPNGSVWGHKAIDIYPTEMEAVALPSHGDLKDETDIIHRIEKIADDDLAQDIIGEILASPTIVEATE